MEPDLERLDAHLDETEVDGYLIDADETDSDQLYLAGFDAPDPFRTLYTHPGTHLLVSGLEYSRARADSRATTVSKAADYDARALAEEHGSHEGGVRAVAAWLRDHDVESVAVPERFPAATADTLRELGIEVVPDTDDVVTGIRAAKTETEIEHMRSVQRANEAAMAAAEDLIAESTAEDGQLYHDGEILTSERVTEAIEVTLLGHGCALDDTIVACGADGAIPHERGSGPLMADEPIVVDIFPRSKETGYHADMTRTFVHGDPDPELRRRYDLTLEAQQAAFDAIEPGVTGSDVHGAVCDVYEEAGYATLRSDEDADTGFIHSTGHGLGLDVHELPTLSPNGTELEPGNVVTVEPGLYDPGVGGVRIEDVVVVTGDGFENLMEYPKELVV